MWVIIDIVNDVDRVVEVMGTMSADELKEMALTMWQEILKRKK